MKMETSKSVQGRLRRHQTAWVVERDDHIEQCAFDLKPNDLLITKCVGDKETPVAYVRQGDACPTDIRMRDLERWRHAREQRPAGFMARYHQKEALKNLAAIEKATAPLTDIYRDFFLNCSDTVKGDVEVKNYKVYKGELGEIDGRVNIIETHNEFQKMADSILGIDWARYAFDKAFEEVKQTIITPAKDRRADREMMVVCSGVRNSDAPRVREQVKMFAPIPVGEVVSKVKPAISGLGTMTPVLAFNSRRDTRI